MTIILNSFEHRNHYVVIARLNKVYKARIFKPIPSLANNVPLNQVRLMWSKDRERLIGRVIIWIAKEESKNERA